MSTLKVVPAVKVPSPFPRRIETVPLLQLRQPSDTAKSSFPSRLKSPTAAEVGWKPTAGLDLIVKLPSPFPRRIETVPAEVHVGSVPQLLTTARSCLPLLSKSLTST